MNIGLLSSESVRYPVAWIIFLNGGGVLRSFYLVKYNPDQYALLPTLAFCISDADRHF